VRFAWVLVLAFLSSTACATKDSEKGCAAKIWGIASTLEAYNDEELAFFLWRAERIRAEIGHWMSDPRYANRAHIPVLGFELDEMFASWPFPFAQRDRVSSAYRAAESWTALIQFTRAFHTPILESGPSLSRSQLDSLWSYCDGQASMARGVHNNRSPARDAQTRAAALALIKSPRVPKQFRIWLKLHLDTMDHYTLRTANVFHDMVTDLYHLYSDWPI
jgi:hypothetical protein